MNFKFTSNDRKLLKVLSFLFWFLILGASVYVVTKLGDDKFSLGNSFAGWVRIAPDPVPSVTSTPPEDGIEQPVDENSYAQNEYEFLLPIYEAYIKDRTYDDYVETYGPVMQTSVDGNNPTGMYRNFCSHILISSIINNGQVTIDSPELKSFIEIYDSQKFEESFTGEWWWLSSAAGFDCLIAMSSVKDILPIEFKNKFLTDIATGVRYMINDRPFSPNSWNARTPDNFKRIYGSASSQINSPIEEAGMDASFMFAAAKLLPNEINGQSVPGSLTDEERSKLINRAKELVKFSVERCNNGCPYSEYQWIAVNHGLDPNPNYTLSGLTQYSEIAMLFNQLGESDNSIFDNELKNKVTNIIGALFNGYERPGVGFVGPYIDEEYRFSGKFFSKNMDGSIYDGLELPLNYNQLNLTFLDARPSTDSSIPLSDVDTMNQYFIPGDAYLKSYTYKDDRIWHFECDFNLPNGSPSRCTATYTQSLANLYRNITSVPGSNWNLFPIPTEKLDSVTQYFIPGTTELRTLIYKGDRVWMYKCFLSKPGNRWIASCQEGYTKTLSENWRSIVGDWSNAGWVGDNTPPTDYIDVVSQTIVEGTRTLKGYITKGSKVWAFECTNVGFENQRCVPLYVIDLDSFWRQITLGWDTSLWTQTPPPSSDIDGFYQYYSYNDSSQLYGYIVKDDRIWSYGCKNNYCNARYTYPLATSFNGVYRRYRWPFDFGSGFFQLNGVSDWGMDATFQNSAFSSMAYLSTENANYYDQLIDKQISRGRKVHPPLPTNYIDGQWNWQKLSKISDDSTFTYLADGWYSPLGMESLSSNETRLNSTWSINILAGKNHAIAYLLNTYRKILKQF